MKKILFILFVFIVVNGHAQESDMPIIDIHLHAYEGRLPSQAASWAGEPEARALMSAEDSEVHFQRVVDEMKKNNIKLAFTSSSSINALKIWKNAYPNVFLTGIQTNGGIPILSPDSLKYYVANDQVDLLGELGLQYYGMAPDDPSMDAYYRAAEENGIIICLHTGLGPPGGPHSFAPEFRTTLGKPSLLEPVLVKYPKLKVFLAHAGWPYMSETIAMMYIYPELSVDIGVLCWALPRKAFHSALEQLMDAGFGKRIMFGTDQMMWPEAISIAVKTVKEVPFLTEEEKRDILYNNAARFLELSEEVTAAHHQN